MSPSNDEISENKLKNSNAQNLHKNRPLFRVCFNPEKELGRSHISSAYPYNFIKPLTGKFYSRYEQNKGILENEIESLLKNYILNPREKFSEPLLESHKESYVLMEYAEPQKPSEGDCCGAGCQPCVFDVYEEQLQKWKLLKTRSVILNKMRYDLLSQVCYKPFKVLNINPCTNDTNIYKFQPVEYDLSCSECNVIPGILPYNPGQHIIISTINFNTPQNNDKHKAQLNKDTNVSRKFTPLTVAKNQENCVIDILIKLYPNGKMSQFISNLKIGDMIYFRGPFGDFSYSANEYQLINIFCAGTGIAPMYSLIQIITDNENEETMINLCYACRTMDDILLRNELRKLSKFWNFEAHIYLSNETQSESKMKGIFYGENIYNEKITLKSVKNLFNLDRTHLVLICGPDSFSSDVLNFSKQCGVSSRYIHVF